MLNTIDNLDSIFQKALTNKSIIKNRNALHSDYVPDHLPFRVPQITSVGQALAPILHQSKPSNLLIYGKTGTGKTAVTRHVLNKLNATAQQQHIPARFLYCNTRMTGTEYRTLADLAAGLNLKIPFTGLALTEVLSRIQQHIKQSGLRTILALDEIDYLVRSFGDDLLYDLTTSFDSTSPGFISIIGISNDLQFKEELGARVVSRLSEEELVFPPYSVEQLRTILKDRALLAFEPLTCSEAAVNLCAALSGSEHGDARRAVDLLRVSGEMAEREGSAEVQERHVRVALQKIDQDRVVEALKTLPLHAKLVLLAAIYSSEKQDSHSSSGSVYDKYCELCASTGLEALTTRRVSGLLTELDTLGLVTATIVNYGRYGRTKRIVSQVSLSVATSVFRQDETIIHLIPS